MENVAVVSYSTFISTVCVFTRTKTNQQGDWFLKEILETSTKCLRNQTVHSFSPIRNDTLVCSFNHREHLLPVHRLFIMQLETFDEIICTRQSLINYSILVRWTTWSIFVLQTLLLTNIAMLLINTKMSRLLNRYTSRAVAHKTFWMHLIILLKQFTFRDVQIWKWKLHLKGIPGNKFQPANVTCSPKEV